MSIGARNFCAFSAKYSQAPAHFSTSALPWTTGFPISSAIRRAASSEVRRSSSARREKKDARSLIPLLLHSEYARDAESRTRVTSAGEASSYEAILFPVAGLIETRLMRPSCFRSRRRERAHRASQRLRRITRGPVLQPEASGVPHGIDLRQDEGIVQLARRRFVPPGNAGNVEVADGREVPPDEREN